MNNHALTQQIRVKDGQCGFTLIELLVVIAIVSILGAVGYPIYSNYVKTGAAVDARNALRVISAAQERYKLLNGIYYPSSGVVTDQIISVNLLNNLSLNNKYYSFSLQTVGCPNQPVTGLVRQFCATATRLNTSPIETYTIDQTDKIFNQLGVEIK